MAGVWFFQPMGMQTFTIQMTIGICALLLRPSEIEAHRCIFPFDVSRFLLSFLQKFNWERRSAFCFEYFFSSSLQVENFEISSVREVFCTIIFTVLENGLKVLPF